MYRVLTSSQLAFRALPAGQASAKIVRGLLVAMLRMIADIRPTVIAIDDAQFVPFFFFAVLALEGVPSLY